jgi:hypothetical protein
MYHESDRLSFIGEARQRAIAIAVTVDLPEWPRSRAGTIAYFGAVAFFLVLTVAVKSVPGPGWLLILPVYGFLAALVVCVALPHRDEG